MVSNILLFSPLFGEDSILTIIFFKWVGSTTNQYVYCLYCMYARLLYIYIQSHVSVENGQSLPSKMRFLPTNSHNIFMKKKLAVSSWYSTSPTSWSVPSRELTYPPDVWHFWVDDFPNFPRWDMLVFLEGIFLPFQLVPLWWCLPKLAFSSSKVWKLQ